MYNPEFLALNQKPKAIIIKMKKRFPNTLKAIGQPAIKIDSYIADIPISIMPKIARWPIYCLSESCLEIGRNVCGLFRFLSLIQKRAYLSYEADRELIIFAPPEIEQLISDQYINVLSEYRTDDKVRCEISDVLSFEKGYRSGVKIVPISGPETLN